MNKSSSQTRNIDVIILGLVMTGFILYVLFQGNSVASSLVEYDGQVQEVDTYYELQKEVHYQ